jgi:hypothetical protein
MFVLAFAGGAPFVSAIWRCGAWEWPHVCPTTQRSTYCPDELADAGWRFHSIAEPPADG